jgi:hypothetical protein
MNSQIYRDRKENGYYQGLERERRQLFEMMKKFQVNVITTIQNCDYA